MRRALFAVVILLVHASAYADRVVTHHFESALRAPAVRRVIVEIPAGEVRIVNSTGNVVRVSGQSKRDYDRWDSRNEQQRIVDDVSAGVYVNGDEATIRRNFGPNARGWRIEKFTAIEATVEVPRGVNVELETKYGEIHFDGSFGDLDVDLHAGEIHATVPRADVKDLDASVTVGEVHAHLGDSSVNNEGVFPGRVRWENPSGGRGRIYLHTTAGEIHVQLTR
ncbi:MAG TPA: hypothetical protein VGJ82_15345 [Thermoanaerobaculia bacterium]